MIYLDHHATTPVDRRVLETMLPYFSDRFGNASSRNHRFGWEAEEAVSNARKDIATLLGAQAKEIVFTSGATESINLALFGLARTHPDKQHLVISSIEHKAVLDVARALAKDGFEVTSIAPDESGVVRAEKMLEAVRDDTLAVALMAANNEVGTLQPIEQIGEALKDHSAHFFVDTAQAVGKVPVDVNAAHIDLCTVSAHKFYGPKGIGALYVRRRPKVELAPLIVGGGHERGLRSGTLNVPGIVGLGAAAKLAHAEMADERDRLLKLRGKLLHGLQTHFEDLVVHGSLDARLAGNLNVAIPDAEAEQVLLALANDLALSSGSACTTTSLEPSHVLRAMKVPNDLAQCSLRFGIGRSNSDSEIDRAVALVAKAATDARKR